LNDFFEPDREIVCFSEPDELVEKARYYLTHDADRERIRLAGLARARAEHTWHGRFRKVFLGDRARLTPCAESQRSISAQGDTSCDIRRMTDVSGAPGPRRCGRLARRRLRAGTQTPVGDRYRWRSQQPMLSADGRLVIVFNGEIYNYRDLRDQLLVAGRTFRTSSDTEVVLEGFQLYGEDVVHHLNGQFAFFIWDTKLSRAFAARDRTGREASLLELAPRTVSSSSHLRYAACSPPVVFDRGSTPRLFRRTSRSTTCRPTSAIYENVQPVPPGHRLTWRDGAMLLERVLAADVFDERHLGHRGGAPCARTARGGGRAADHCGRRRGRLFFSAGVSRLGDRCGADGAATAAPSTHSQWGFGALIDELPFARAVAEAYGTTHHELQMDIAVGDTLERVADAFDEPFGDSSNIPTFLIAEFARRRVKVVLSGDGGDELFGGYEWYRPLVTGDEAGDSDLRAMGINGRALLTRAFAKVGVASPKRTARALHESAGVRLNRRFSDPFDRHIAFVANNVDADGNGAGGLALVTPRTLYRPGDQVDGLDRAVDFDVRCYLPGDILAKVDRASMAHGLEVRAPFLDAQLVDFVLSLPVSVRLDRGSSKSLLAAAVKDLWPDAIRRRPKQGSALHSLPGSSGPTWARSSAGCARSNRR